LDAERLDFHGEGTEDLWIHGSAFSAVVRPARGGSVTDFTVFARGGNLVDVLTRRREAYHRRSGVDGEEGVARDGGGSPADAPERDEGDVPDDRGMPSIHDREEAATFEELPPVDRDVRALLVDRVLPAELEEAAYARAEYDALLSWARASMGAEVERGDAGIVVRMTTAPPGTLEKVLVFREDGSLRATWRWDPADFPPDARFAPELSLSAAFAPEVELAWDPEPEAVWRHPIETLSRSEEGPEATVQGASVTPLWPCRLGRAGLEIRLGPSGPEPSGDGGHAPRSRGEDDQ
ncbi:MAG TPA: alpha-amylase/4-alpha-glucanotransferase domain-containing protein, partial [Longimicrobiales bacterium]|nr:alpha-amylase/4-alpha-glucanotransferase domain-containing protein [Longimicrobiales bacterium]